MPALVILIVGVILTITLQYIWMFKILLNKAMLIYSRSYDSRESRSYRPSPPGKPEPRNWNASSRYPDATAPAKGKSFKIYN